jgi:hypothetical protein
LFVSGYTPVFSEIYMGTLYGRWPAAPVWASLLPLCDRHGQIDMSPQAIAGLTGWPMDLLQEGIRQLSEPDEHSRTPDNDGRRLVLLDPARPWGWKVVNHGKYREKARKMAYDQARVADGRNAERLAAKRSDATRDDPTRPAMTRADPPSDSNTNKSKRASAPASRKCPPEFEPDADFARAECPDMDVPREISKFRDWEFKTARKDWPATWRTWVRNCRDRGQYAKGSSKALPPGVTKWL